MDNPQAVFDHFPDLTPEQKDQIKQLGPLYASWNEKINLISRKDIEHLYHHHILHSLSLGLIFPFPEGMKVLDIGTGGGLPGIPLAILFPDVHFHLVDSTLKKINVVKAISEELGLKNITATHQRAEKIQGKYDLILGRAVKPLPIFLSWIKKNLKKGEPFNSGVLYLKGGDLENELSEVDWGAEVHEIKEVLGADEYFETKKVVHLHPELIQ